MIANPHLIGETTPAVIREGFARIREVTRYPLVCLSVMEEFYAPGRLRRPRGAGDGDSASR